MKIRRAASRGASIVLAGLVVSACQSRPEATAPRAPAPVEQANAINRSAPTLQELRNATYQGVAAAGVAFTLTDGKWEGKPYEPGAASRPSVTFVRDFRLVGDIDGDGQQEAVVLLDANAGATSEIAYLAVVGRPAGNRANIATALVGDRVQVHSARIDGRRIVLEVVQAGEADAACCPGDLVRRSWELQDGALTEGTPVKTGRLSIEAIAGTEWVLRAWAWDEAAAATSEVTLRFDGTRLAGNAGCNTYFARVTAGNQPGGLEAGPIGTTRTMCPESGMAVETRFLQQLGGVTQMRFVAGQLALHYAKPDKSLGVMLFDRRAAG